MNKKETAILQDLVQKVQTLSRTIEQYSEYAYQWGVCTKAMRTLYDSNVRMLEWKQKDNDELKAELKKLAYFQTLLHKN